MPIYDDHKQAYIDAEYWVRRVDPNGKGCKDKGWQQGTPEVAQSAPYDGIALMCGSYMPDGTTFGFIDVDRDDLVAAFRIMFEPKCERIGSKGTAIPVRVDRGVTNAKFRMKGASSPAVEMLFHQSICVIPPSIHHKTKKPYVWVGKGLLEIKPSDLPLVDAQTVNVVRALIENDKLAVMLSGSGTHDAMLSLIGKMVHFIDDDAKLKRLMIALLPKDYEGDEIKKIPDMIKSARKNVNTGKWDKIETELERSKSGALMVNAKNTMIILERMKITSRYDEFADKELVTIGERMEQPARDDTEQVIRHNMDLQYGYKIGGDSFRDTMAAIARSNSFHPVRDYLKGLKWDGVERVGNWLCEFGGAEDSPYVRAVSKLVLVAAVRRIMRPGAKFDEMAVLFSPKQGTFKSTALRTLAIKDEWFCDSLHMESKDREFIEQTQGKWIVEIAELKGMHRSQSDHIKSMLSRQSDRARRAYGRMVEERPRHFIMVGTTNESEFLRDETGNRRFWPVEIKEFDISKLKATRDQLWAEAYAIERTQIPLIMSRDLWDDANSVQDRHRVRDNPYIDVLREKIGDKTDGRIASSELMDIMGIDKGKISNVQYKTLKSAMLELGWVYRVTMRFGSKICGGYTKGNGAEIIYADFCRGSGESKKTEY